jgi:hypothetical protein
MVGKKIFTAPIQGGKEQEETEDGSLYAVCRYIYHLHPNLVALWYKYSEAALNLNGTDFVSFVQSPLQVILTFV